MPRGSAGLRCTLAPVPEDRRAYEVLAANLHSLMHDRELTLEDVARAADLTPERLREICEGKFDPDLETVDRIARAVGVTASELIAEPTLH